MIEGCKSRNSTTISIVWCLEGSGPTYSTIGVTRELPLETYGALKQMGQCAVQIQRHPRSYLNPKAMGWPVAVWCSFMCPPTYRPHATSPQCRHNQFSEGSRQLRGRGGCHEEKHMESLITTSLYRIVVSLKQLRGRR